MEREPEEPLTGGRVTAGVVRVGDSVRRPRGAHSVFVAELLEHLASREFDGAPRWLGIDEQGRDTLTYIPGDVPPDLGFYDDEQLKAAFKLLRRFHDATSTTDLAGGAEVVCHGDISPCNTVFRNRTPVALIDFDTATPGRRIDDLGYGLFLWLDLGNPEIAIAEQRRRLAIASTSYGRTVDPSLVAAIALQVALTAERLRAQHRESASWWEAMHKRLLTDATYLLPSPP